MSIESSFPDYLKITTVSNGEQNFTFPAANLTLRCLVC